MYFALYGAVNGNVTAGMLPFNAGTTVEAEGGHMHMAAKLIPREVVDMATEA